MIVFTFEKLRNDNPKMAHAITSMATPNFRRQPWKKRKRNVKKSTMIQTPTTGVVSLGFFGVDWRGLPSSRYAESRVSGMTI